MPKGKYKEINIEEIRANPKNPRGIEIVEDEGFKNLTRSIKEIGVLRPLLIVQENGNRYRLIDGFRRLEAADKARLDRVPCIVIRENDMGDFDDEDYMFQIHMNFEGWEPIEQALALVNAFESIEEKIPDEFTQPDKFQEKRAALVKAIKEKYNMERSVALNIVRFLSWPEDIIIKAQEEKTRWWSYIISIESEIIEPAIKNYPDFFVRVMTEDQVREALFNKVRELKSEDLERAADIRYAREVFRKPKTGNEKKFVIRLFKEFLKKGNKLSFEDIRDTYLERFPEEKQALSVSTTKLYNAIGKFEDIINSFDKNSLRIKTKKNREKIKETVTELELLIDDIRKLVRGLKKLLRG